MSAYSERDGNIKGESKVPHVLMYSYEACLVSISDQLVLISVLVCRERAVLTQVPHYAINATGKFVLSQSTTNIS